MLGPREFNRLIVANLYHVAMSVSLKFKDTFLKLSVQEVSIVYGFVRIVERLMRYILRHPSIECATLWNKFPKTILRLERSGKPLYC